MLLLLVAILGIWKEKIFRGKVFSWVLWLLTMLTVLLTGLNIIKDINSRIDYDILQSSVEYHEKIIREKDERISELEGHIFLINSMEIRVQIHATTTGKGRIEGGTSVGLANAIALFSKDGKRYRFITDFEFTTQQMDSVTKVLRLVYFPETPNEILGKHIQFLQDMDVLVIDYSDFLKGIHFLRKVEGTMITKVQVVINGIEALSFAASESHPGVFSEGQSSIDVGGYFLNILEEYGKRVKELPNISK
jgi:hypothetical protein